MLRWASCVDTPADAAKAAISGILGALGFAGWLGIPLILAAAEHNWHETTSLIESIIVGLLICLALLTAWRFWTQRGWIAGPVLLIASMIEIAKRVVLAIQGSAGFSVVDAMIASFIFLGLVSGVRGAQARRTVQAYQSDRTEL